MGFTLAVIYGDVLRVVLLFYLAPVWTMLFARALLGERLSGAGYGVMLIALAGAALMLWQPAMGWPLPRTAAEWLGLSAGAMFALSNVLIRKTADIGIPLKVLAVFFGGIVASGACIAFAEPLAGAWGRIVDQAFLLLHFALRRQWRTVVSGGLSLLAVTAATALLFGVDCFQTFLHKILPNTAVFRSQWTNSSLIGWSTKLFNPESLQEQVEPWIRSPWLEKVVSALLPPARNEPKPRLTRPAPASEPMVSS